MTHNELLASLTPTQERGFPSNPTTVLTTLRAVVELHKPSEIPDWVPTEKELMCWCAQVYPCPTIQAIEKELA